MRYCDSHTQAIIDRLNQPKRSRKARVIDLMQCAVTVFAVAFTVVAVLVLTDR